MLTACPNEGYDSLKFLFAQTDSVAPKGIDTFAPGY